MKVFNPIVNRETEVEVFDDSHEPWLLVRCKETDFHFIANPPSYDRLEEEFAWEKTIDASESRRRKEGLLAWKLSKLAKQIKFLIEPNRNKTFSIAMRIPEPKATNYRILDVGCGDGKLMLDFREKFYQAGVNIVPIGIEVSNQLAEESAERFAPFGGYTIKNNAIDGMKQVESGSIDMVLMNSFLEHESRPVQLLQVVKDALKDNGCVVIKVPNFDCLNRKIRGKQWAGYRFPDHVSYFTPATLKTLATETGFKLQEQSFTARLPFSDNMYAVFQKV
jgi:SAM-dependent methyltransferase